MYSLDRIDPPQGKVERAGASGILSDTFRYNDDTESVEIADVSFPTVGWVISVTGPSRWWRTSEVTEIISVEIESISVDTEEDRITVIFKTLNSTYEWNKF